MSAGGVGLCASLRDQEARSRKAVVNHLARYTNQKHAFVFIVMIIQNAVQQLHHYISCLSTRFVFLPAVPAVPMLYQLYCAVPKLCCTVCCTSCTSCTTDVPLMYLCPRLCQGVSCCTCCTCCTYCTPAVPRYIKPAVPPELR